MDVLIKGMEMPKEGNVYLIIGEDGVVSEKIGSMYHVTTEAIELPPHGRLGDLDAIADMLEKLLPQRAKELAICKEHEMVVTEVVNAIIEMLREAPTVLEDSTEGEAST